MKLLQLDAVRVPCLYVLSERVLMLKTLVKSTTTNHHQAIEAASICVLKILSLSESWHNLKDLGSYD